MPGTRPALTVCGRKSTRGLEESMQLYAILRRSGWRSPEDLQAAAARSFKVGDEDMPDDVRWIRSYVLDESGGAVGTVCIYEATSPEAIRRHASLADLPVDEIVRVADTVVVRADPAVVGACCVPPPAHRSPPRASAACCWPPPRRRRPVRRASARRARRPS